MPLPTVFLPHGAGPCFFMEWTWGPPDTWDSTEAYLRGLIATLPERPKAILVISAHWETEDFTVGSAPRPDLIFDYYNFPEHTYRLTFDAPGAPGVAARVRELLTQAGVPCAEDPQRGWDHGVFIPMLLVTPEEDIPVVQLSLKADLDPAAHIAAGRALAPLRDEGVLILGSGMSWHNPRPSGGAGAHSAAFHAWLESTAADVEGRDAALARWDQAPGGREGHPREEHLLPLMVTAGAAPGDPGRITFRQKLGPVEITAIEFGAS